MIIPIKHCIKLNRSEFQITKSCKQFLDADVKETRRGGIPDSRGVELEAILHPCHSLIVRFIKHYKVKKAENI